jgi:hypothetical protein
LHVGWMGALPCWWLFVALPQGHPNSHGHGCRHQGLPCNCCPHFAGTWRLGRARPHGSAAQGRGWHMGSLTGRAAGLRAVRGWGSSVGDFTLTLSCDPPGSPPLSGGPLASPLPAASAAGLGVLPGPPPPLGAGPWRRLWRPLAPSPSPFPILPCPEPSPSAKRSPVPSGSPSPATSPSPPGVFVLPLSLWYGFGTCPLLPEGP